MIATGVVFVLASLFTTSSNENTGIVFKIKKSGLRWTPVFLALFILGNDFWAWGRKPVIAAGLPLWIWYYIGLGILLSVTFKLFFKYTEKD
jgi:hypothetical protein